MMRIIATQDRHPQGVGTGCEQTAETKAWLTLPDAAHRLSVLSGEDDNVREPINSCSTDF
jgi:hypothetical protein